MDSKLYIIVYPSTSKYAEGEIINPEYDSTQRDFCPMCGQPVSSSKWAGERVVKVNKKNIPDFLYLYGSNMPFVISEKGYRILNENGITGVVKANKIDKIIFKENNMNETFYQLYLERMSYAIDHINSNIVYGEERVGEKCELCSPSGKTIDFICGFRLGMKIDKDIFNIYEMGDAVLVSERFIQVCKDNKLIGLFYEEVRDYNSAEGIYSKEEIIEMIKRD